MTSAPATESKCWVPAEVPLVYATGVLELALAAGFFLPATRRLAGRAAALLLVAFFPVNVWAAMNYIPFSGHELGPPYLLVRGPLQIEILAWVYVFTLRQKRSAETPAGARSEPPAESVGNNPF